MNYVDLSLKEFAERLGSGDPTPGGGGAAAYTAAQGIALTKMVAEFTTGKKKYAEYEEEVQEILAQCQELMDKLVAGVDADKEGFSQMAEVFAMPKSTDEEKEIRSAELQKAFVAALIPPFTVMELSVEALNVTERTIGKTNTNVASDIGVAALLLKSALQSGWLNVVINISSLKDEELAEEYRQKGEKLIQEGTVLADKIYEIILEQVK